MKWTQYYEGCMILRSYNGAYNEIFLRIQFSKQLQYDMAIISFELIEAFQFPASILCKQRGE